MVSEEEHHNAADQSKSFMTSEGSEDLGLLPRIDSAMIHGYDLSHLSSILNDITIQEWRQSTLNKVSFRKSKLIDSLDVEDTLYEALTKMQEGLNFLAFVSKDKTRLYGCLQMSDVLQFMTTHWLGKDLSIFRIPLRSLDMLFQTELVRCKETDSLFSVLRKMRDQRVGVVPIESSEGGYTVGLCFLNDLIYLLRKPDFHTQLS